MFDGLLSELKHDDTRSLTTCIMICRFTFFIMCVMRFTVVSAVATNGEVPEHEIAAETQITFLTSSP